MAYSHTQRGETFHITVHRIVSVSMPNCLLVISQLVSATLCKGVPVVSRNFQIFHLPVLILYQGSKLDWLGHTFSGSGAHP